MIEGMKRINLDRVQKAEKAASELETNRQGRTLKIRRLEDIYHESVDPDNPSCGAKSFLP